MLSCAGRKFRPSVHRSETRMLHSLSFIAIAETLGSALFFRQDTGKSSPVKDECTDQVTAHMQFYCESLYEGDIF